ncbi:MAG: hypothetical protein HWE25_06140 [Alphaproteobacteria bacterium]|nr:hypothetical protein [Alphaproteobacteria bacterium]
MAPAFKIDRIDDDAHRHPLGAVSAYAVRHSAMPHMAEGRGLVVMGELSETPEGEEATLTQASTELCALSLEISNGEKTYRGPFKLLRFDPVSHLAIFWSAGAVDSEAAPA